MNERIRELAEQAGVLFDTDPTYTYGASPKVLERFAELVDAAAVAREREACAKLCEDQIKSYMSKQYTTDPLGGYRERFASEQCAKAIRGRTE
jgi:hypothetical protein